MPPTEEQKRKNRERVQRYRIKNREKIASKQREYYHQNTKTCLEKCKLYCKKNPEKRSKTYTIYNWKKSGLVCDDYNELYENYLKSTHCEECGCQYGKIGDKSNRFKCMDHNHVTGLFRNFLCNRCNLERR